MIAPLGLTLSVKVKLIVLILEVEILFLLHAYMNWAKEWGKVAHFHYILKMTIFSHN